ncbi:MAG: PASTA domain-containing protein [Candidatus Hydrogenedentes bacterium]|nr:PASTA domain-containing protein [Candidatus Hydrogenedentota bacterium]
MNAFVRVVCVVLGLGVAAVSAAAPDNGKRCAPLPEKAAKGKGAAPGARTPISGEPWTPMGAQDKVVYGTDDRIDVYQETDPLRQELAGSVCGLVDALDLTPISGGRWELSLYTYTAGGYPACSSEPFGSQPVVPWCTGFLVGEDLIATAGHCFADGDQSYVRFIFGFEMTSATTPVYELEASQVYTAVEVVGWALSGGLDYCVVRVDRPVTASGAQPLQIRREGTVPLDTPLGVIGHPSGLPKKLAFGPTTKVAANTASGYFTANLDTYGGNSGSPVFNAATGVVEGILVRGAEDFVLQGACFVSNVLPDSAAGEDVSKSTTFAQYVPEAAAAEGKITLDKEAYKPTDMVQITVEDVLAVSSVNVEIEGEHHTKTLVLNAVKAAATQFTGAVQLYSVGKADPVESLFVLDGGEMTVRYNDEDDGSGSPAVIEKTVAIDGTAPAVANASAVSIGWASAAVRVEASEPVTATVRYGTACGALTQTALSAGGPVMDPVVTLGGLSPETPYYFAVDVVDAAGNTASSDNGGACFTFTTAASNDLCADAIPLEEDVAHNGDSTGAGLDYDTEGLDGADVWFSFTPGTSGMYDISLCGSSFDTTLAVFLGGCGDLVNIGFNDDFCGYQSQVRKILQAGVTHLIRVADRDAAGGAHTVLATYAGVPGDPCPGDPVADSGFETGSPSAGWEGYSLHYGTPLCDASCNDDFTAYEGDWFVWFGGADTAEQGWILQHTTLPVAGSATLSFHLRIPTAGTTGHMALLMDRDELFRVTEADAAQYAEWTRVELDISGYADGGLHELAFESAVAAPKTDVLNIFVDKVCIETGEAPVRVPNVVGQTQAAAEAAIVGAGLALGGIIEAYSETVPAGQVMGQSPAGGATVPPGTAVSLDVSKGPVPTGDNEVPDVVGTTQTQAEEALLAAQLTLGTVTEVCDASVPKGTVISQDPGAGRLVADNTPVSLTVSSGPCPAIVKVPNVVGQSQAAAGAVLANAGLSAGAVTRKCSDSVPEGSVISHTPAGGAPAMSGAAVALVVSSGPCPVTATVPNLVGQTRVAAEAALTGAGLTLGAVTEVYSDTVAAGVVISQSPAAGATAAPGSAVSLTVSKGVDPAVTDAARTALQNAFYQADADDSGTLTFDEAESVVLTRTVFSALDTNGDGVLDKTELGLGDAAGGGCGCAKSGLAPDGWQKRLGDLFLGGLALVLLAALGRRAGV